MDSVDEIISNKVQSENGTFDKESWIKRKQEERTNAYKTISETAEDIVRDDNKFKTYLDIQGVFDKYSTGNCLLIFKQMPNASQIKDFEGWKEAGAYIKKNAKSITILEPGDQYTKADGTISTSYNAKKVFDVSQTSFKPKARVVANADRTKLSALLNECPVDVKVVEDTPSSKLVEWNKADHVLYVKKNEDIQATFIELSQELAKVGLEETGNIEIDNFKSSCIGYMICKKQGIDVSSYDLKKIPVAFQEMTQVEIRNELNSMRSTMEDMNSRISQHYEKLAKTQKSKDIER